MDLIVVILLLIPVVIAITILFLTSNYKYKKYIYKMETSIIHINRVIVEKHGKLNEALALLEGDAKPYNIDELVLDFKADEKLSAAFNKLKTISDDHKNVELTKIIKEIDELNEYINAYKKYYNDNINKYNKLVRTLPTNIIGFLLRYKEKNLI